ncbi:hypothetical protein H0H81_006005 [Sphagnurus paluster]|uniref:Uncharacterized protein n=1 Tax=Sphagnurus paluster TaxID=117069 RepID=A0A9P7KG28_9AGAR|nr:hypothetical protein H0H81_006005 [Sphagnurus paluster]
MTSTMPRFINNPFLRLDSEDRYPFWWPQTLLDNLGISRTLPEGPKAPRGAVPDEILSAKHCTNFDRLFKELSLRDDDGYVVKLIDIVSRFMFWMGRSKEADVGEGYCGKLNVGGVKMLFFGEVGCSAARVPVFHLTSARKRYMGRNWFEPGYDESVWPPQDRDKIDVSDIALLLTLAQGQKELKIPVDWN